MAVSGLVGQDLTQAGIGWHPGLFRSRGGPVAPADGLTGPVPVGEPPLSERQVRILVFFRGFATDHACLLTVREIIKGRLAD